jgi:hypothetical protein
MSLEETFTNLAAFLNSLDTEAEQKFELAHSLVIICPDDGKNIAFRGRCPKCGGNSWIPAGHSGGIFERMKAQRWRTMTTTSAADDDDVEPVSDVRESRRVNTPVSDDRVEQR